MGRNLETQYSFRCDEVTIKKLEYIASQNTRTRNQEMKHIIKIYVADYEAKHGEIKIEPSSMQKAIEAQKKTIRDRKENGIIETFKNSLDNGLSAFADKEKR